MSDVRIQERGIEAVLVRLKEMSGTVRAALEVAVQVEALDLVRVVKEEKLSGQVLGQRTKRLRNAVHVLDLDHGAASVTAAVGVNLGDAAYAAFWEYGFTGTEEVREHLRTITQAFGRPIDPRSVLVRAHARNIDQPARSYLRSALAERQDIIRAHLRAAVDRAVAGGAA